MKHQRRADIVQLFARNLRARRVEKRMSQTQMAGALDCYPPYVSKVEGGKVQVRVDTAQRFADVLGCNVEDLLQSEETAVLQEVAGLLPCLGFDFGLVLEMARAVVAQ